MNIFNKRKKLLAAISVVLIFLILNSRLHFFIKEGKVLDSVNDVEIYFNGKTTNSHGRTTGKNGYNIGQKWQCVEFVKRYYYQHLNHQMPESFGDAKNFFHQGLKDGQFNASRGLLQYTNGSKSKPMVDDIVVFDGTKFNKYGHVAIVTKVFDNKIEIAQQNKGTKTREKLKIYQEENQWFIKNNRVLGWLRKR